MKRNFQVEFNSGMVEFRSVILRTRRRDENSVRPWQRRKKRAVTETSVGRLVNRPAAVVGAEMPARPAVPVVAVISCADS
ncbi:hypothetical protein E2C01_084188 [Portunus trituberculatus]|uniref:Uncharacterized protein n=1 Tax=Portunus trituberculatus TaxID=210409 RepID=A0A5B7IUM6_PORTR|nr:hypothetical protein [Portunus trituberculatus]